MRQLANLHIKIQDRKVSIKVLFRKEEEPELLPERGDEAFREQPLAFLGEQPVYDPLQVINSNVLQPLLVVQAVGSDGYRDEYVLIDEPKSQNSIVYVRALDVNTGFERKIGLADYSILPYQNGNWSDSGNYLILTGQRISLSELNNLMNL